MAGEYDNQFEDLTRLVSQVASQMNELSSSVIRLEGRVDELAGSIKMADSRVHQMAESLKTVDGRVNDLTHSVSRVSGRADEIRLEIRDMNKTLVLHSEKHEEHSASFRTMNRKIDAFPLNWILFLKRSFRMSSVSG